MRLIIFVTLIFSSYLFASFSGKVIDEVTNKPISNVTITDSKKIVKTDDNGSFVLDSKENIYHVKAIGYRPFSFNKDYNSSIIKVAPIKVKALYLTFWGASNNSSRLKKVLNIIKKSKANAVIVDVKNEYGSTVYLTSVKKANDYGANDNRTNRNIHKFINTMKENNIYTIARIVTFKDEIQASNNPDYAIKNAKGKIWRNHDNMAWVDPFNKKAHKYILAIAEDAASVGFDEINFDYIRFPAKRGLKFSKPCTQSSRIKAISNFLDTASNKLRKYGVFISADTYGNICWSKDDNGIGQTISSLAKHVDYLAPMLYPSGFSSGSFNFKYPANHPHAVIYRSIKHIENIIDTKKIRPWLQYFKDYTKSKRDYNKFEVKEQIRATKELDTNGWMMWSPSSRYHLNYLR